MKKHMFLWCIVLAGILHFVCGRATTTLNCSEPGFLGQSYNIICHTTGTISSGIVWIGPGDRSVAACKPLGECVPNAGYNTSVTGKQYMLHIDRLGEDDAGTWKCTDGASDSNTEACSLNLASHPRRATTTLNCSEPGFLGQSYNIICHTTGTISSGIVWIGPGDRSVAACKPLGECVPNAGYNTSVTGKQYMLHIDRLGEDDAGTWKCTDGASDSNTEACSLNLASHPNTPGSTSGKILLTANKVCVGLFLATVCLFLYVR